MTIFLQPWVLPLIVSVAIVLTAAFWPLPQRRGDYDFSAAVMAIVHVALAVFALLATWLCYFIWLTITR